jgi:hypothetical protein
MNAMYYSPILFSKIADVEFTQFNTSILDMEYLNAKDIIIVFCASNMDYLKLIHFFLDYVKKPFILITAMEDGVVPLHICENFMKKITTNNYFKHWFAINKIIPNDDKFTSIPYGLCYWTLSVRPFLGEDIQTFEEQNTCLQNIIDKSKHFSKRIPKIYGYFHFNSHDKRYGCVRKKLLNIIPTNIIDYQSSELPRTQTFNNIKDYAFVVSPFGNGPDCIRTFEALCLGCIVIMKKSFLDIVYEGLPVLLVDEWEDINEELLNNTLIEYSSKEFNYEKLKMDYWINLVYSKF